MPKLLLEYDAFMMAVDLFLEMEEDEMKYVYDKMKKQPDVKKAFKMVKELTKRWNGSRSKTNTRFQQ